jgi:hypothetical protein
MIANHVANGTLKTTNFHFITTLCSIEGAPPILIETYGNNWKIRTNLIKFFDEDPKSKGHGQGALHNIQQEGRKPNQKITIMVLGEMQHVYDAALTNSAGLTRAQARTQFRHLSKGLEVVDDLLYMGQGADLPTWKLLRAHTDVMVRLEYWGAWVESFRKMLNDDQVKYFNARAEAARALEEAKQAEKAALLTRRDFQDASRRRAVAQKAFNDANTEFERSLGSKLNDWAKVRREMKEMENVIAPEEAKTLRERMHSNLLKGAGYSAFNGAMSWAVLVAFGSELEKVENFGSPEDRVRLMTLYYAAAMNMAAAVTDAAQLGVEMLAAQNWRWAAGVGKLMNKAAPLLTLVSRGGSATLSWTMAYWDLRKANRLFVDGDVVWAIAYYISAGLGFAGGGVLASGVLAHTPLGKTILFFYAFWATSVTLIAPSDLERWLKGCYFGREPLSRWSVNWGSEISEFSAMVGINKLTGERLKNQQTPAQQGRLSVQ